MPTISPTMARVNDIPAESHGMPGPGCWYKMPHALDAALSLADFTKAGRLALHEALSQVLGARLPLARLSPSELARRLKTARQVTTRGVDEIVRSGVVVPVGGRTYRLVSDFRSWTMRDGATPRFSPEEIAYCEGADGRARAWYAEARRGGSLTPNEVTTVDIDTQRGVNGPDAVSPNEVTNAAPDDTQRGDNLSPNALTQPARAYKEAPASGFKKVEENLKTSDRGVTVSDPPIPIQAPTPLPPVAAAPPPPPAIDPAKDPKLSEVERLVAWVRAAMLEDGYEEGGEKDSVGQACKSARKWCRLGNPAEWFAQALAAAIDLPALEPLSYARKVLVGMLEVQKAGGAVMAPGYCDFIPDEKLRRMEAKVAARPDVMSMPSGVGTARHNRLRMAERVAYARVLGVSVDALSLKYSERQNWPPLPDGMVLPETLVLQMEAVA